MPADDRLTQAAQRGEFADAVLSMPAPAPAVDRETLIRIGAAAINPAYGIAAIKKATLVVDALISRGLITQPAPKEQQ